MKKTTDSLSYAEKIAGWLRRAVVAVATVLPLVVFPGIARPFSIPKIYLLSGFVIIAWICVISLGLLSRPELPSGFLLSLGIWVSALVASAIFGDFVSWETLWLSLCGCAWFLVVIVLRPNAVHVARGMILTSAVIAAIALLQYAGFDPFHLLGWVTQETRPRMRVMGTLGNPNFVSALLVSAIPLSWAPGVHFRKRFFFFSLIVFLALAVFATESKAGILAASAVLLWLSGVVRTGFARRAWIAAGALAVFVLVAFMPSRSLMATVEGRLYIWRVTATHLMERPLFGYGPGAFEPKFIQWETFYWRDGHGSEHERKYAQLQAHAHNDYIETMVDSGLAGLLGLVSLLSAFFVSTFRWRRNSGGEFIAGASAGVISLAAVALVDFPLHRPAELFFLWTLMAVAYLASSASTAARIKPV